MINHRLYERQTFLNHSNLPLSSSSDDETMARRLKVSGNLKRFCITIKFRSLWMFILFIIYSICIINIYNYFFIQPDFSSKLISSSYACHDTPSCAAKIGLL